MIRPDIGRVPNFVQASRPEDIRATMLAAQVQAKGELHFFDIQFVNNKWIAWYIPIDTSSDPFLQLQPQLNKPQVRSKRANKRPSN